MEEVKGRLQDHTAIITLTGRIDSNNAAQVEEEIFNILSDGEIGSLCIDMQGLEFFRAQDCASCSSCEKSMASIV
jgi:anti-anti-sigma factor